MFVQNLMLSTGIIARKIKEKELIVGSQGFNSQDSKLWLESIFMGLAMPISIAIELEDKKLYCLSINSPYNNCISQYSNTHLLAIDNYLNLESFYFGFQYNKDLNGKKFLELDRSSMRTVTESMNHIVVVKYANTLQDKKIFLETLPISETSLEIAKGWSDAGSK